MVKYATAIRTGHRREPSRSCAASPAPARSTPPTPALVELGRAVSRTFVARLPGLGSAAPRDQRAGCRWWRTGTPPTASSSTARTVNSPAPIATAEMSLLALHLLQSALVHVNTLLLQAVLEDPQFHDLVGDTERRALTPLFWSNINPYGRFRLDMDSRLDLSGGNAQTMESVV